MLDVNSWWYENQCALEVSLNINFPTYIYIHAYTTHMHAYIHTPNSWCLLFALGGHLKKKAYIHTSMHTCTYTHIQYTHALIHIHIYIHACRHTYNSYIHICMHAYKHPYMHACKHTYKHTDAQPRTDRHTNTATLLPTLQHTTIRSVFTHL